MTGFEPLGGNKFLHFSRARIFVGIPSNPVDYIEPEIHPSLFFERIPAGDEKFGHIDDSRKKYRHGDLSESGELIVEPFDELPHG